MALTDVLNELDGDPVDEEQLAGLLNKIDQSGINLSFHFNQDAKKWNVSLAAGNDLFYYGIDFTLPKAIAKAMRDWLKDFKTNG